VTSGIVCRSAYTAIRLCLSVFRCCFEVVSYSSSYSFSSFCSIKYRLFLTRTTTTTTVPSWWVGPQQQSSSLFHTYMVVIADVLQLRVVVCMPLPLPLLLLLLHPRVSCHTMPCCPVTPNHHHMPTYLPTCLPHGMTEQKSPRGTNKQTNKPTHPYIHAKRYYEERVRTTAHNNNNNNNNASSSSSSSSSCSSAGCLQTYVERKVSQSVSQSVRA